MSLDGEVGKDDTEKISRNSENTYIRFSFENTDEIFVEVDIAHQPCQ